MKKIIILFIFLFGIIISGCSLSKKQDNTISLYRDGDIVKITKSTNCSLRLNTTVGEKPNDSNVLEVTNGIQDKPLIISFYDLDKDSPYMESNGGRAELTKIDNGNHIYLLEKTSVGNIVIYTLFKNKGVLIMSKQYDLVGAFGTQMVGYCK